MNKTFCVAFKTLPEDSTGVFHILEHSVLCGSAKYPVREPFVELMKSSMATFLNAMTFPDKTIYPVSSRNEQDFLNLAEVYLDAVFAPRILQDPNIFYQEGWHIELDENGAPLYKGVVFNEMKGAMSDVDEQIYQKTLDVLFPDNCYGWNSGGDPKHIPDLTYEQFLRMYRRYYHPSNARIYLDGAVPLDKVLTLAEEYLSCFDRLDEKHEIPMQKPFAAEAEQAYEIGAEEDTADKTMLTLAKIVAPWSDTVRVTATEILFDVLTGSNDAPLKKALLATGNASRRVAATSSNEHSSRSHMLFVITVQGETRDSNQTSEGRLVLVDLAGSERVSKTESTGQRLVEGQHINKSLSSLGDVIHALNNKHKHVPFRNSTLTFVLQDVLAEGNKVLMVAQLSPALDSVQESLQTLEFANRVNKVQLGKGAENKTHAMIAKMGDAVRV